MRSLSIIIPARNEHPAATFTLQRIWDELENSPWDWETILVDNLSEDKTGSFCKDRWFHARGQHKIIEYTEKGSCWGARNAGLAEATGEIIFLFDAHVLVSPGFFDLQMEWMLGSDTEVLYTPIVWMGDTRRHTAYGYNLGPMDRSIDGTPVPHHLFTKFWGSWTKQRESDEPYRIPMSGTAGVCVRGDHLRRIGGWPDPLSVYGGGEQWLALLTWMLGGECRVDPRTYAYHLADNRGYSNDPSTGRNTGEAHLYNTLLVSYALGGDKWWRHRVKWVTSDQNPHAWKGQYREAAWAIAADAKRDGEPYRLWVEENAKHTLDEIVTAQPWRLVEVM